MQANAIRAASSVDGNTVKVHSVSYTIEQAGSRDSEARAARALYRCVTSVSVLVFCQDPGLLRYSHTVFIALFFLFTSELNSFEYGIHSSSSSERLHVF